MNPIYFSFVMFLFYTALAVTILIIGPFFAPNLLPEPLQRNTIFGYLAACFAVWKLVQWWSFRSNKEQQRQQELMEEEYRVRAKPRTVDNSKPIENPEFQFDETSPPPHRNGASR
jgi:hypothetical protein